jgi:membrane-bound lytic murein transglycosylase D
VRFATLAAFALTLSAASTPEASRPSIFPEPEAMEHQVGFWTRIYVEIGTDSGFVHDDRMLTAVYETMHIYASRRIRTLADGSAVADADARRASQVLRDALGRAPNKTDFLAASQRLRFQLGQRNRFREGLVRAGNYEPLFREILASYGLPRDLAYLPHMESSFNNRAFSKPGAAGMWQFIRSTGRRFLRIDNLVDERMEPIKAAHAAAKLLRSNFRSLENWPLAITAYNHGAAGMRRARKAMGSSDIATITERYDGRRFGFASRNFYAQFLAARRVALDYKRHFGPIQRPSPAPVRVVPLPFYADSKDLQRHLGVSGDVLAQLNPSLRPSVLRSEKYIPKGFELRLPTAVATSEGGTPLATFPAQYRHDEQRPSTVHTVRRGETLSHIAKRYNISVPRLVSLNTIRDGHRIYVGQKLELTL